MVQAGSRASPNVEEQQKIKYPPSQKLTVRHYSHFFLVCLLFFPSQIPPVPKANRFCGSVFVINSVCNFGNEASRQTLQAQSGLRFPKMFRQGQKLYLVSEHLLIEKWTSKMQFLCIVAKGQMYRNIYIYIISILHFLILGSPSSLDTGRALHLGRLLASEGSFNIPFSMTFTKLTELFGHLNTGFPCQKKT